MIKKQKIRSNECKLIKININIKANYKNNKIMNKKL